MAQPVHPDVERARAHALVARARLANTMSDIQQRLTPRALLRDAWEEVQEHGAELADDLALKVRQRPFAATGAAALLALFVARKPLFEALVQRFWRSDETAPPSDSSGPTKAGARRSRASEET